MVQRFKKWELERKITLGNILTVVFALLALWFGWHKFRTQQKVVEGKVDAVADQNEKIKTLFADLKTQSDKLAKQVARFRAEQIDRRHSDAELHRSIGRVMSVSTQSDSALETSVRSSVAFLHHSSFLIAQMLRLQPALRQSVVLTALSEAHVASLQIQSIAATWSERNKTVIEALREEHSPADGETPQEAPARIAALAKKIEQHYIKSNALLQRDLEEPKRKLEDATRKMLEAVRRAGEGIEKPPK